MKLVHPFRFGPPPSARVEVGEVFHIGGPLIVLIYSEGHTDCEEIDGDAHVDT